MEITKKQIKAFKEMDEEYKKVINKSTVNRPLAKEFIECAKRDKNTAEYLYKSNNKEFIPNAVFNVQQSVEKYSKAYALLFGAVSRRKMKEIGHDSSRAFIKSLRNPEVNKILKKLKKVSHLVYENGAVDEVVNINPEEEANTISELVSSREIGRVKLKKIIDGFEKLRLELAKGVQRYSNKDILKMFKKDIRPVMNQFILSKHGAVIKEISSIEYDLVCFLFPLLFKMSKHEEMSRYPKIGVGGLSPKDYIESEPEIVKEIPRILPILDNINKRFNMFFDLVEKYSKEKTNPIIL